MGGKKKMPDVKMVSFGLYTPFDREGRQLPQVVEFTTDVPARLGVEFGYILQIRKVRGETLTFEINHPPFTDDSGNISPPFTGEVRITDNDYRFFLGDTLWEPLEDKLSFIIYSPLSGEVRLRRLRVIRGD